MNFRKIVVLIFIGCSQICRADDLKGAQDIYIKGTQFEKSRNYQQAIQEYQAALNLAPNYFWAYRQLGNCYYYLGQQDQALDAYNKYLAANPGDQNTRKFVSQFRDRRGNLDAPEFAAHKMAFGLNAGFNTYAMGNWNSQLNLNAVNSSGVYSYSGTPINGGLGLNLNFRYLIGDKWDIGAFADYLTGGGSFVDNWVDSSGVYHHTGNYGFPTIFLGPSGNYTFYRIAPNLSLRAGAAIGYLSLLGANMNYTYADVPNSGPIMGSKTVSLSGYGFGTKVSVTVDMIFSPKLSASAELGYRVASIGQVNAEGQGTLMSAGSNVNLDYSGFVLEIGLAYWH